MKIIKYTNPSYTNEFNRIFDWAPFAFDNNKLLERACGINDLTSDMPVSHIREDEANYYVHIEIPGVKKEEVHLELKDNVLTLKTETKEEKEGSYRRASYNHAYKLPRGINGDSIDARLEDGVLTVTLPKVEEEKAKAISVK